MEFLNSIYRTNFLNSLAALSVFRLFFIKTPSLAPLSQCLISNLKHG